MKKLVHQRPIKPLKSQEISPRMSFSVQVLDLSHIRDTFDDFDDFNLPLIIALTTGLGVLFLFLLVLTIYFSFFNNGAIFLGSQFNIPGEFDDEENRINEEEQYLPSFVEEERESYIAAKNFETEFPPVTNAMGTTLDPHEREYIKERGIQAYLFEGSLASGVIVVDKLDVKFPEGVNSVALNYPLPTDNDNDTVYFEVKMFELPEGSTTSIGLGSKPYPLFRLPGYSKYSIAYESNGTVRINQPFYSPSIWPKLIEGDVIGCGFKQRSGTIFFTHNGKKVLEAVHNVKLDLFPMIGSKGEAKLDVNLGQLGFVFIEANVKKWGFGSTFGSIGVPPAFREIQKDAVLDKGEDLPPNYPSEEDTFFGPSALLSGERPTRIISNPPSYKDEPKPELISDDHVVEINEEAYESRSSAFGLGSLNAAPAKPMDLRDDHIIEEPELEQVSGQEPETDAVQAEDTESRAIEESSSLPLAMDPPALTEQEGTPNEITADETDSDAAVQAETTPEADKEATPESETTQDTPEEETPEHTPEQTQPTSARSIPTNPKSNNKRKKKKKKKGKKK